MEIADPAASLMTTHARLRSNGFGIVSVVSARTTLDARVWLGQWCRGRGTPLVVSPSADPDDALMTYRARLGCSDPTERLGADEWPVLLLPDALVRALPAAARISGQHKQLPVAITCGLGEIVEGLLDPAMPLPLVSAALEGLVPTADAERQVLQTVAKGRKLQPFLRGACEGLVYYMLEARSETRGLFTANARVGSTAGRRTYEVDIFCESAKVVIEIDGPEHDQPKRKAMDARKQADLEAQGYRVRRFSNQQVIEDPVGVWQLINEQVANCARLKETT